MPTVPDIHRRGTRAAQATIAAPPLTVGTLYFVTDEGITERWNGTAWESYSGPGTGAAPTAHHASHQSGGTDAIKLDDLAAPDDNTDLDASTTAHGLLRKLSGVATQFLNGLGVFSTLPTSPLVVAWTVNDGTAASVVGPYLRAPRAGALNALKYIIKAAGAASLVFDVKKNGTSLLSAPVTVLPSVGLGAVNTVVLATLPTGVALDDVFTLEITSGSSAWQLQLQVET